MRPVLKSPDGACGAGGGVDSVMEPIHSGAGRDQLGHSRW
jgi:hypothetical protein